MSAWVRHDRWFLLKMCIFSEAWQAVTTAPLTAIQGAVGFGTEAAPCETEMRLMKLGFSESAAGCRGRIARNPGERKLSAFKSADWSESQAIR